MQVNVSSYRAEGSVILTDVLLLLVVRCVSAGRGHSYLMQQQHHFPVVYPPSLFPSWPSSSREPVEQVQGDKGGEGGRQRGREIRKLGETNKGKREEDEVAAFRAMGELNRPSPPVSTGKLSSTHLDKSLPGRSGFQQHAK